MSQNKKRKKKHYPGTPSAAPKDPAMLQDETQGKKMDPLARRILFFTVALVALAQILDYMDIISRTAGDILTILGVILLLAALVVQARSSVSYRKRGKGSGPAGPHL